MAAIKLVQFETLEGVYQFDPKESVSLYVYLSLFSQIVNKNVLDNVVILRLDVAVNI